MDPLTIGLMMAGQQGGNMIGQGIQGITQYLAAQKQLEANKQAQNAITQQYQQAMGYQQPYLAAGQEGLNRMMQGNYNVNVPGQYQPTEQQPVWNAPQFNFEADPGYQFSRQQGIQAGQAMAGGAGTGLSGATMKALAKYGTGLANQTYNDAYERYMQGRQQGFKEYGTGLEQYNTNRLFGAGQTQQQYRNLTEEAQNRYGRATDLGKLGYGAAGNASEMATGYGTNLANLYGARGDINANRVTNVGNTIGNMFGSGATGALDLYGLGQLNPGGSNPYLSTIRNINKNPGIFDVNTSMG